MAKAALSIRPFERSRWRLRRTREVMGKAAGFRLVFARRVGASTPAESVFDGFAGAFGSGAKASKDWREKRACARCYLDTRIAHEPKPVAPSSGDGSG